MGVGLDYVYVDTHYYEVDDNRYIAYDTGGRTSHGGTLDIYSDGTMSYDHKYSYITINNVPDMFKGGDFYDMMCILIHEQDHYDTVYNPFMHDPIASEFLALGSTIYNEYFVNASPEFREIIYSQYRYFESLYYNSYY